MGGGAGRGGAVIEVSREEFAGLVEAAVAALPEDLRVQLDVVQISIEDEPTGEDYRINGVPDDDLGKARKRFLLHLSAVVIRGNSKHLAEYRRTSTVGLRPVGARHLGIVAPPPVVPQADEGLEAALQAIADLPEHMEEPVPLQEEAPVEVAEAAEGHVDEVTQLTPDNEF